MPHRIKNSIVIKTDNGEIDFAINGDKIIIHQLEMEPSYIFFEITKEDWGGIKIVH